MKKYLITGFVILLPLVLTLIVMNFLFNFFTAPFLKLIEPYFIQHTSLPMAVVVFISRLLSLVLLCMVIFVLGIIARWFFVRHVLSLTQTILTRIPFIRSVYKVSRDVFAALFSTDGKKAFQYPVMMPFAQKPTYSLGFQAGDVPQECQRVIPEKLVSVFIPTAPHPLSGFLLLAPAKDVYRLDMSNEDAFKYLVSCGMIHPETEVAKEGDIDDL